MTMTNLGITKEEIIYQLALRVSTVDVWHVEPFDIVNKATKIYDELIEKDIIKEIACVEPGKSADNPHSLEDHEGMVWDLNIGEYVYPENLPSHWHYVEEEE